MPKIPKIERVRVFAVESPSALDLFENRTESHTLQTVCRLLGHEFASTIVRSDVEFKTALNHATTINPEHIPEAERKRPFCLHIAAHGNSSGIALGADNPSWEQLAERLWRCFGKMAHYQGPKILVISACKASNQKVTTYFQQKASNSTIKPPAYVFTTVGDVPWSDAVVAWSLFYHQIGKAVLSRSDIQLILDKIQIVGAGQLMYFRWDSANKKYWSYLSKSKEHTKQAGTFKAVTTKPPTVGRQQHKR
jgi:hypothetical protein